jgi:peptidoglycan/xylan/chitin deacetylase (PgdA/CDA1 family)
MVYPAAALLPEATVDALFRRWVGTQHVALCLHRVHQGPRRPTERLPEMSIPAGELDVFLDRALSTRPQADRPWLTVSFDDGYEDALRYVQARVRRYPQVEWLFFICPQKVEQQAGFRWDLVETGAAPPESEEGPVDVGAENERPELRALAQEDRFRLATVERCRELARLPGVSLGNHTNLHHKAVRLSAEQAAAEYESSHRDFERLFGPCAHFAFPFGTPEVEFRAEHVALARRLGRFLLWSTEARTYAPEERVDGAVLPRFAVDGRRSAQELMLWVAARALRYRLRGSRHAYPPGPGPEPGVSGAAAA